MEQLDDRRVRQMRMASLLLAPDPGARTRRNAGVGDAGVAGGGAKVAEGDAGEAEGGAGVVGAADPAAVAAWFGAMQAQDLASARWSLGVRLPDSTERSIDAALAAAEVLRTWPMRGTIHLVAAADAAWMVATLGGYAMRGSAGRRRQLGLDAATHDRAARIWASELSGAGPVTRGAALELLTGGGIDTSGQRGYHLLAHAGQSGLLCIGPNVGRQQTFVLLEQWAPDQHELHGDEAWAELALRYFRSHGPATRRDFARWCGSPLTAADRGIALAQGRGWLAEAEHRGETVHFLAGGLGPGAGLAGGPAAAAEVGKQEAPATRGRSSGITLLPGYDELILGYGDRAAQLPTQREFDICPGRNGVFRPTIVCDGRVVGTWRSAHRGGGVAVAADFWSTPNEPMAAGFDRAAARYASFLGVPLHR